MYNTYDFRWYWLSTKLHWNKLLQLLQNLLRFLCFLFYLLILLCYQIISLFQALINLTSQRAHHVESTSILRRYVEEQISTNFHAISTYFFDVISLTEKSSLVPHTFFDAILLVEKSTLFPRTFFDVILLVEKSTLFPGTFFDAILLVKKSTLFPHTFFHVISLVEKSTLFPRTFFNVISMAKTLQVNLPSAALFHWNLIKSYKLRHSKKKLLQVSFLCIYRTTTLPNSFLAAALLWSYSCKKA